MKVPSDFEIGIEYSVFRELSCAEKMDVHYQIYARENPDFGKIMWQKGARERWRFEALKSSITIDLTSFDDCALEEIRREINSFSGYEARDYPIFCGIFGSDLTEAEMAQATRMRDLLIVSSMGSQLAAIILVGISNADPRIRLFPEVRYFVQEIMWHLHPDSMIRTAHLMPEPKEGYGLTLPRMEAIKHAAKRGDLEFVIGPLVDCKRQKT